MLKDSGERDQFPVLHEAARQLTRAGPLKIHQNLVRIVYLEQVINRGVHIVVVDDSVCRYSQSHTGGILEIEKHSNIYSGAGDEGTT